MEVAWFFTPKEGVAKPPKIKTTLTVFFGREGVISHEYAPPEQTMNKEYYMNVLWWLRDSI